MLRDMPTPVEILRHMEISLFRTVFFVKDEAQRTHQVYRKIRIVTKKTNYITPSVDQKSHLNGGSLILTKRFIFHLLVMPKKIFTHSIFHKMHYMVL